MTNRIQAFPQLRLFKEHEPMYPDYRADRTVEALIEFLQSRLAQDIQVAQMDPQAQEAHEARKEMMRDDHPGCLLSGFLLVNRVPGNFHIEARSKHHNINPVMANLSHSVNHLSVGPVMTNHMYRRINEVPEEYFSSKSTVPMDGSVYVSSELHQAYHHYLKVVSTNLVLGTNSKDSVLAYQIVQSSQVMKYFEEDVPEARFTYDLSPMAVVITRKGKKWYEFITSICALIGGTFTVVGLISGFLSIIFKAKKI